MDTFDQKFNYTPYEMQYMRALKDIYEHGHEDGVNERTGRSTKRLPGIVMQVDVEKEFPILKSKFVAAKTALREILWIWQQNSNNIQDLKAHIWDSWADSNGSIGNAYGNQAAHPVVIYTDPVHKTPESFRSYPTQTHFILNYLREFPAGRWGVGTLWNPSELSQMNLVPCCHTSTWNLDGGRLNCVLDQRSGDMPYGVPFNTTQYAELMILFARDLGVKPGILTHVIADAHIYDNQMAGVEQQIANHRLLCDVKEYTANGDGNADSFLHACPWTCNEKVTVNVRDSWELITETVECKPEFKINTESTNFWDIKPEDCEVVDYKNLGKIDFGDVAV